MKSNLSELNIKHELERTQAAQFKASDPRSSVWVSANAGTGKTHVLTMRVLRLLLSGTEPERILCLTYTRAAAAEMSKRVFSELSRFVGLDDQSLHKALFTYLLREPTLEEKVRARTLFTQSIETPGGFKAQTIHAFAERLLQRFPLEAGVTPGFKILEDMEAKKLKQRAIDKTLEAALKAPAAPLGKALSVVASYTTETGFEGVLSEALQFHEWLEDTFEQNPDNILEIQTKINGLKTQLKKYFDSKIDKEERRISEEIRERFSSINWVELANNFEEGSSTDINRAQTLRKLAISKNEDDFIQHLCTIFFDSKDKPRKSFSTKALQKKYPEIEKILLNIQYTFFELWRELKVSALIEATLALYQLSVEILHEYQIEKSRCGKLDFEDLIIRTKSLLFNREASQWVLYKLDSGLDHLLVDESQDTSLSQWMVISSLVQEIFSGEGISNVDRTIFAVGDEKQSIYSFQGAAPQMFIALGEKIKVLASQAGKNFEKINLNVSFRSTKPILETVDKVFSDASRTPGVSHEECCIQHISKRFNQAGSLEVWNKEFYTPDKIADPWSLAEGEISKSPIQRLASRIANTIEHWLQNGERLVSADRPIRPGDILILLRKRHPFADTMLMALKSRGIPVAGADRLRLKEHIVVQDLLSLGQFILLPEDDLSLAEVLKSPIFGFDDDDLLKISVERRHSLWSALLKNKDIDERFRQAVDFLKRWRSAADFMPPYEFWARLLDSDGVRSSLINRIGPEAAEPLDEFLSLALKYDSSAPASLTGFIQKILQEDREIKRDTETTRDEVRIMTVHGAKGLEAPIVFLPDTCCSGRRKEGGTLIKLQGQPNLTNEKFPPFVWAIKGSSHLSEISDAKLNLEKHNKEEQERLLYVALTRARDRLIIGGFENKIGCTQNCWYALICDMLSLKLDPSDSKKVLHQNIIAPSSDINPDYKKNLSHSFAPKVQFPTWINSKKAPKENVICIPIKPSEIVPYIPDFEGDPSEEHPHKSELTEPVAPNFFHSQRQKKVITKDPFLRGKLTHSLIQYLPRISSIIWEETALRYVKEKAPQISTGVAVKIVKETLHILADPLLGGLFGSGSQSEVPIIATIPDPKGSKKNLRITGQIDRLIVNEKEILIVDFKTNRKPPSSPSEVANIYIYQLAAYRIALMQIFKNRPIRAGLLWTEIPKFMEIPADILEKYTKDLWTLNIRDIDDNF